MSKSRSVFVALLWVTIAAIPLVDGHGYYRLSPEERPFSPLYESYKPAGLVGHGLGIFGSLMIIVGVSTYSIRKRVHALHALGKLRSWLTFHIFLCTLGPFLVLMHTTFKIGNIAAIAFWSMAVVVGSGVFGRYVYQHIPKGIDGVFFGAAQLVTQRRDVVTRVSLLTGQNAETVAGIIGTFSMAPPKGLISAIWATIRFDLRQRVLTHQLSDALGSNGVDDTLTERAVPILVEGLRLDHNHAVSGPMQRLFGYWHVLHIPLAIVMLITFVVHVGVAIAFGYTWIF